MARLIFILTLTLFTLLPASGQQDSLEIYTSIALRGRRQTGNVNQLGLNPSASLSLERRGNIAAFEVNYDFLRINKTQVVSDFWTGMYLQRRSNKRVYPIARLHYGFAKSYKIERSIIAGLGAGLNLIKPASNRLLQINFFAGFMDVKYEEIASHEAPVSGGLLKSEMPIIKDRIHLIWQLETYHSLEDGRFWGVNNKVHLLFPLLKKISLSLSHSTIFNNTISDTIERTNTLMLFGFMYRNK